MNEFGESGTRVETAARLAAKAHPILDGYERLLRRFEAAAWQA